MGKRGPRPKPTALKIARGNPGKRKLRADEPKPPAGVGDCPDWLDAEGKACWAEHAPQLEAMGVLTGIDRQALMTFCDIWSRYKKAIDFIRKHGEFLPIKDEAGKLRYMCQFPQVSIAQKLLASLLRYQQEFGLTPSARSGLVAKPAGPADDLDSFVASKPRPKLRRVSHGGA